MRCMPLNKYPVNILQNDHLLKMNQNNKCTELQYIYAPIKYGVDLSLILCKPPLNNDEVHMEYNNIL